VAELTEAIELPYVAVSGRFFRLERIVERVR